MTIAEMATWSKRTLGNKAIPGLIIFTAAGSFGLGLLAHMKGNEQSKTAPIQTERASGALSATAAEAPTVATPPLPSHPYVSKNKTKRKESSGNARATIPSPAQQAGKFVASKTGHSYYLPSCGTAKRIKPQNKVYFEARADAEKAGYAPAKNCKGL